MEKDTPPGAPAKERKTPLILVVPGFVVITVLPVTFFIFGWHGADVSCTRDVQRIDCQIEESFAAHLYVRKASAQGVREIGYQSHQTRRSVGPIPMNVLTSNLVFDTAGGEIEITSVSSNTADDAKRQLIKAFRAWRDDKTATRFEHHADMVGIFGYLGALGTAFWAWILLSWPYYALKKRKGQQP